MRNRPLVSFFLACLLLSLFVLSACEGSSGKSYAESYHHPWDYSKKYGPEHWGELDKNYENCRIGLHQSPIDIHSSEIRELSTLKYDYQFSIIDILDNGHTIEFDYEPGSYVYFNNDKYELIQFHFHSPSEHKVNEKKFPMEIHLVHKNKKSQLLVVGIFAKEGNDNMFINNLWAHFPKEKEKCFKFKYEKINISSILPQYERAYYYLGSLTTPPCTENVHWIIFKEPIEMSKKQIDYFHKFYNRNARPTQNARK